MKLKVAKRWIDAFTAHSRVHRKFRGKRCWTMFHRAQSLMIRRSAAYRKRRRKAALLMLRLIMKGDDSEATT